MDFRVLKLKLRLPPKKPIYLTRTKIEECKKRQYYIERKSV